MIITCGQCQAKFKVAPEQIKESGSKVRCSNCRHVFTVYRPAPPREEGVSDGPLDEALKNRPARSGADFDESLAKLLAETADDDSGDFYGERPLRADSPRERRTRRRQLYSDLEDEPGKAAFDDSLDDIFDDEEDGENPSPHPPLRRAGRAAPAREPDGGVEDESAERKDGELPPPLEERNNKDSLGLNSDPARGPAAPAQEARGASIRAAEDPGRNPKLLLILAIVATALLVGLYFMANRPEPLALSVSDPAQPGAAGPAPPGAASPEADAGAADPGGTLGITFSQNNQNHYFRENIKEGPLLIITGMVRNSYPAPRSFIHLRGRLVSADGSTLADRYAYAGNLISEEELINLPISEIFSRLSIKGGQNGQNMNVEPGREVPFMLVFDKLPDGMTEYRIDPMGSSPSE